MTREDLYPPRTLADALSYYANADFINALNTARAEAKAEAKAEIAEEIARKMKINGFSFDNIADVTSVPIKIIEKL
jgi:hypothetical protein